MSEAPAPAPEPESAPFAVAMPAPVAAAPQETPAAADGIAIVGMACRFPGAPDLQSVRAPARGWLSTPSPTDGRTAGSGPASPGIPAGPDTGARRGGFIEEIDKFDARFFGITPIGARTMDPQHRLLLETSWRALDDAGLAPETLRGSTTGVYAGVASSEYRDLMIAAGESLSYVGTAASMAVGGIAFNLDLQGPALAVDLNCASSLVAVHHAVLALGAGEVDLALAGGVNTILSPGKTSEMAALGMLSPTGQLPALRRRRRRLRARRGLRNGRPEAARPGGGRRRPDLGGHPGIGGQPERRERRPDGAERRGPAAGDRNRAVASRDRSCGVGLSGGAREWFHDGRPHRDAGRGRGVRQGTGTGTAVARRLGEGERRAPGDGRGSGGAHQGRARHQPGNDPRATPFRTPEPPGGMGPASPADPRPNDGVARPPGSAPTGCGQRVRGLRRQRAPRHGGARTSGRCAPGARNASRRFDARDPRRPAAGRQRPGAARDAFPPALGQIGRTRSGRTRPQLSGLARGPRRTNSRPGTRPTRCCRTSPGPPGSAEVISMCGPGSCSGPRRR